MVSDPRFQPALQVTASFGLAELGPGLEDPKALIEAADGALYRAKTSGRNQLQVAAPGGKASS
jgi:two-component system cell cycle response regulator